MAWYSVLEYKIRHDLLALLGGIATYIQGGFMIANAHAHHDDKDSQKQHNNAGIVWQTRLVCALVGFIALSVGTILIQHAMNLKKKASNKATTMNGLFFVQVATEEGKEGHNDDINNETNHGEFQNNDAEDHGDNDDKGLAALSSSEIINKPWDKYVIQGAALRFVAMMAYSVLNITTIPDLLPQTS